MLVYEHQGFLEVETRDIQQLCRSVLTVSLGGTGRDGYDLHAVACEFQDKSERRCQVAFYAKKLRRALVYTAGSEEGASPWSFVLDSLAKLGFQLEDVNLKLSPAMLEVVLRDIPGLATPLEARNQNAEHLKLLAGLQETYNEDPESKEGQKAALKLNSEKRINEQSEKLRAVLETLVAPEEPVEEDLDALQLQVKELAARLAEAEALADSERRQKELSESITAAAEKRIQELEEVLVDVETKSSETLKQKRKIKTLQDKVKDLEEQRDLQSRELVLEQQKQEMACDDVQAAEAKLAQLTSTLKDVESARDCLQSQLNDDQERNEQLSKGLQETEQKLSELNDKLEKAEQRAAQGVAAVKLSATTQAELAGVRLALSEAQDHNKKLSADLLAAAALNKEYEQKQRDTDNVAAEKEQGQKDFLELTRQHELTVKELDSLRQDYERERSLRQRLENRVVMDKTRIAELEDSLARMQERSTAVEGADDPVALKRALQEQARDCEQAKSACESLEQELDAAHKMIDSLEQMLRETDTATGGSGVPEPVSDNQDLRVLELEERLQGLEKQLQQGGQEQERLARMVAAAEAKLAEQAALLAQKSADVQMVGSGETKADKEVRPKESKPLPHELRPAPKKGVFFRPEWDLEGLPCRSADQVFRAWEAAFNVQLSLEGYPSQYCMAFLVVLRLGKLKKLFMLYSLKKSKHTLVCVPSQLPKDEKSLQGAVAEGLKFLKLSGFEMDEMSVEHIESTLASYFLDAD